MAPIIICLRHAQAQHNVDPCPESYSKYRDPVLTRLGEAQARTLRTSFPYTPSLIQASPLRRTIQTALLGLASPRTPLELNPDLQEADEWPCDTGSDIPVLEAEFSDHGLDFSHIPQDWNTKKGVYAPTPEALEERARRVRRWLRKREEQTILVVTHGGFLAYLVPETQPFANAEWRVYQFQGPASAEDARLTRIMGGDAADVMGKGVDSREANQAVEDHSV